MKAGPIAVKTPTTPKASKVCGRQHRRRRWRIVIPATTTHVPEGQYSQLAKWHRSPDPMFRKADPERTEAEGVARRRSRRPYIVRVRMASTSVTFLQAKSELILGSTCSRITLSGMSDVSSIRHDAAPPQDRNVPMPTSSHMFQNRVQPTDAPDSQPFTAHKPVELRS